jgi:Mn-dependent DtxR family transcriptional regulator
MNSRTVGDRCAIERTILQTIEAQNTSHVGSLQTAVDADPVAIDRRCFDLQRKGYIRPIGSGHYQLTAEGEGRLRRLHAIDR